MDIKNKLEEIVKKITSDKDLLSKFQKDPASAVKEVTGIDIPDEQLKSVVTAVKAKMGSDAIGGILGGLMGKKDN